MNPEGLLLELLSLSEEVLEHGPGQGRGFRIAGLVLRLNELMHRGEMPLSWRPASPRGPLPAMPSIRVPGPGRLPTIEDGFLAAPEPDIDAMIAALDDGWDDSTIFLDAEEVELLPDAPITSLRPTSVPPPLPARRASVLLLPPDERATKPEQPSKALRKRRRKS